MKTTAFICGIIFSIQLSYAGSLLAPRSSLSYQDDDAEIRAMVGRDIELVMLPQGAYGFIITQGLNDWAAVYVLPSESKGAARFVFLCKGMPYGDPEKRLIRREMGIESVMSTELGDAFRKHIMQAVNAPIDIKRPGYSRTEYWVAADDGEVLAGMSFSTDDHPEFLRRVTYIMINLAKDDESNRDKWNLELMECLQAERRPEAEPGSTRGQANEVAPIVVNPTAEMPPPR